MLYWHVNLTSYKKCNQQLRAFFFITMNVELFSTNSHLEKRSKCMVLSKMLNLLQVDIITVLVV